MTNKDSEENKKSPSFINVRSLIPKLSEDEQSFRYWILKKSEFDLNMVEYESAKPQLFLLTVFAINKEGLYHVTIDNVCVMIDNDCPGEKSFLYFNHNNSELQALEESLKFVKKEMS